MHSAAICSDSVTISNTRRRKFTTLRGYLCAVAICMSISLLLRRATVPLSAVMTSASESMMEESLFVETLLVKRIAPCGIPRAHEGPAAREAAAAEIQVQAGEGDHG